MQHFVNTSNFKMFVILVLDVILHCFTFSLLLLNKNNIGSFVHIFEFTSASLIINSDCQSSFYCFTKAGIAWLPSAQENALTNWKRCMQALV